MEIWVEVRRRVLAGEIGKREACREYHLHWDTLKKSLAHPEPPGYRLQRPRVKPALGPFLPVIHQILEADRFLVWEPTPSDVAYHVVRDAAPEDATIRFRDTLAMNATGTTLTIRPPGQPTYAATVSMRYAAASWTASQIETVDAGLAWAHALTGNTKFLKDSGGKTAPFERWGAYVPYDVTDKNGDTFTDAIPTLKVVEAVAANSEINAGAWNNGANGLAFTAAAFPAGVLPGGPDVSAIVIHELAHNWDNESVFWGMWCDLSGWVPRGGSAAPGPGQSLSGDGAWFHNTNAPFYRPYSRWSPYEDWATTFEAYYQKSQGRLSAAEAAAMAPKFAFVEAFVAVMRG